MTRRLVDLSMPVHPDMLTFPRVPPPGALRVRVARGVRERIGAAEFGVTSLTGSYLVVQNDHVGTHMDARKHIVPTAGGPETIPLEWCYGDGVLLDFRECASGYVITADDVKAELKRIELRAQAEGHRHQLDGRRRLQHRGALPHRPSGHVRGGHALAHLAGRADDGLRRHHVRPAGLGDVREQAVLGGPPCDVGRGVLAPREPDEPRRDRPAARLHR